MKILVTGSNGYIGTRLIPALINKGYKLICCVRHKNKLSLPPELMKKVDIIEVDFLDKTSLTKIPKDIDGAYYLMHSMSSTREYEDLELSTAQNFKEVISKTNTNHVIYLSGIINEKSLSRHLASRKAVEDELSKGDYYFTTLRAGIIIGSGSASFEIIKDLVEKLPVMVAPKWVNTKCQPVAINDVISFLAGTIFESATFNKNFDIGGPDILSYKEMMLGYAEVRGFRRYILTLPVMTPRLSSYWLYFVTSTSYNLAVALVNSMKIEVVCRDHYIDNLLNIKPISYKEALKRTLTKAGAYEKQTQQAIKG